MIVPFQLRVVEDRYDEAEARARQLEKQVTFVINKKNKSKVVLLTQMVLSRFIYVPTM